MGKLTTYYHAFNTGVVDKDKLPRIDLQRMRFAAEQQTNFIPLSTGAMFVRPGTGYIGATDSNNEAVLKPFIFGAQDAVLMEFTDQALRLWVDDVLLERGSVTSTVTSGDPVDPTTGWTDISTTGGTLSEATATFGVSGAQLDINSRGGFCGMKQEVTTSSSGEEHALRIKVSIDSVLMRVGSSDGADDLISETTLRVGEHSLAFTPAGGSYWVQFERVAYGSAVVETCKVEASGAVSVPATWTEANLSKIRTAQSADVVFVGCGLSLRPQRIERRSNRSWSVVEYAPKDGPWSTAVPSESSLSVTGTDFLETLSASGPAAAPDLEVLDIVKLDHSSRTIVTKISAEDEYTDTFRVTGVVDVPADEWNDRNFFYTIAGTWSGTLKWQRSFDSEDFGFTSFRKEVSTSSVDITGNVTNKENDDTDQNAIIYYKLGFAPGDYTSGTAEISVSYDGSGGSGYGRIVKDQGSDTYLLNTVSTIKNTTESISWKRGAWSAALGYPTAPAFFDGRLFWGGFDRIWGSVSDAFDSFDEDFEGDAGPISRSVAIGGTNGIQWVLPLQRLIFGTAGAEVSARSSSLDQPLTATDFTLRNASTIGSAEVEAVAVDDRGIFVERSGTKLFELVFSGAKLDYASNEISKLTSDIFSSGVKQIAVQRRPDTRIWAVLDSGDLVCCVYEPEDEVVAFVPITISSGEVESVAIIPSSGQDKVYFSVKRTVNAVTVRYIEKLADDDQVAPDTLCRSLDAFVVVDNGSPSTTVSGLSHLEGETVSVWADGAPVSGTFTVSSGSITLTTAATDVVVGLAYTARYKSARLAYAAEGGTAMGQNKKVQDIGLILTNFVRDGVKYGPEFDNADHPLDSLPELVNGIAASEIVSGSIFEDTAVMFEGVWNVDSRVCIEVQSPNVAKIIAMPVTVETNG